MGKKKQQEKAAAGGALMTIGELLADLGEGAHPLPVVGEEATVDEIINAFVVSHHSRLLYVVDSAGCLSGVISFGQMIRHVFYHYHGLQYDTRSMVHKSFSETARDFMQRDPLVVTMADGLEMVLERMVRHNVKEVPVVDQQGRVVADLTMVDLLKRYRRL